MKLTTRHKDSMRAVMDGADVFDRGIAGDLREIQREHPELITITKPMNRYDPVKRLPYFGAILTAKGRGALKVKP